MCFCYAFQIALFLEHQQTQTLLTCQNRSRASRLQRTRSSVSTPMRKAQPVSTRNAYKTKGVLMMLLPKPPNINRDLTVTNRDGISTFEQCFWCLKTHTKQQITLQTKTQRVKLVTVGHG